MEDEMGCDIHMYVEHSAKSANRPYWTNFGGRINPGRDYLLFANLAGVRSGGASVQIVETRGLPDNLAIMTKCDNELYISNDVQSDGSCTRETAEIWIKNGYSNWTDDRRVSVTNPDHHTHSWCTVDEFRLVLNADRPEDWGGPGVEYWAMLAACDEMVKRGQDVRIVFWFDN